MSEGTARELAAPKINIHECDVLWSLLLLVILLLLFCCCCRCCWLLLVVLQTAARVACDRRDKGFLSEHENSVAQFCGRSQRECVCVIERKRQSVCM